jgi:hypothetical protein
MLARFRIERNSTGPGEVTELWRSEVKTVHKVNALVVNDTKIVIGGFSEDGKGIIEIWEKQSISS